MVQNLGRPEQTCRPVLTKRDMTRRWIAGEFGNKIDAWPSVTQFMADCNANRWPQDRPVALRNYEPGSPHCYYDLLPNDAVNLYGKLIFLDGVAPDSIYVNDSCNPDDKLVIQGEVSREPGGLHLRYSTVQKKMRLALAEDERYAIGAAANAILDHYVDASSREWIDELLDRYPDHVIEFSTFSVPWGSLNLPTIIWEVRMY